jgi:hypothetical protein
MKRERLTAASIDQPLIKHFIRHHLPVCTCPAPCRSVVCEMRAALHHLLRQLPEAGTAVTTSSTATELKRFHDHLQNTCGLTTPLTCTYRVRHLEAFFASCSASNVPKIDLLTAEDIDSFLSSLAVRWKPSSRG